MKLFSVTINMYHVIFFTIMLLFYASLAHSVVVKEHGYLAIEHGQLVNQYKKNISLAGPSLYWSNNGWAGENFYSKSVIDNVTKLWKASIVRVAIGVDAEGGYLYYPKDNLKKAFTTIDAAIENDIYVIIDWHSHHAEDNPKAAIIFFELMAKKYGHLPNIIYEIYNEPLKNTDWNSVIKPYSINVISAIRAIDKDNIILVGSQSWSQDVDIAAKNPITDFNNIAYTLHFYAGTHTEDLRTKAQKALDAGLALFVSEWGTVAADGDGEIDYKETEKWLAFMKKNKLSHCSWALSQLDESSAMFKAGASITGKWSDDDLTDNGLYLKKIISQWHIH